MLKDIYRLDYGTVFKINNLYTDESPTYVILSDRNRSEIYKRVSDRITKKDFSTNSLLDIDIISNDGPKKIHYVGLNKNSYNSIVNLMKLKTVKLLPEVYSVNDIIVIMETNNSNSNSGRHMYFEIDKEPNTLKRIKCFDRPSEDVKHYINNSPSGYWTDLCR